MPLALRAENILLAAGAMDRSEMENGGSDIVPRVRCWMRMQPVPAGWRHSDAETTKGTIELNNQRIDVHGVATRAAMCVLRAPQIKNLYRCGG